MATHEFWINRNNNSLFQLVNTIFNLMVPIGEMETSGLSFAIAGEINATRFIRLRQAHSFTADAVVVPPSITFLNNDTALSHFVNLYQAHLSTFRLNNFGWFLFNWAQSKYNKTALISTIKYKIFYFTISFAYHIRTKLNRLTSNMVGGFMDIWEVVVRAPIISEGKT